MVTIRKGYSDGGRFGQLHWRGAEAVRREAPDLFCLHPAPFSGLAFTAIMPALAGRRRVWAPDYPGHGGSDPFRHDATVADYAQAMVELIERLTEGTAIDVMGFHTGCLVAAEVARIAPRRVRALALVDVPAFDPVMRERLLASSGAPLEITPLLGCLEGAWDLGMTKRIESQGLDRSFEMFAEQLRHGRGRNAAFHAGFSCDVEALLAGVRHRCLVLATQSMLLEPSRRAAGLIPAATLVERLDIRRAVLDEAAAATADEVIRFLERDDLQHTP
jgi:pimeloyl-ACP methyl ester carboxylesterase